MKNKFCLYQRGEIFYAEETETGNRISLKTKDRVQAKKLLHIKNEAATQPSLNIAMGKILLAAADPKLISRTWQDVIEEFCARGKESSRLRKKRAADSEDFDLIRNKKIVETTSDDFRFVLKNVGAYNNGFLRCLQNLALGYGWLNWPIIAPKSWPEIKQGEKRGITQDEHLKILASEKNPERKLYYEFLWETGASQTDAALLTRANIDLETGLLSYRRLKTDESVCLRIGSRLETIVSQLPAEGFLFPTISKGTDSSRASEFSRRCRIAEVTGVSLHCYRHGWAERARACGYPERFAQEALGHASKAIHRAYARHGAGEIPPLEQFEEAHQKPKVVKFPVPPPEDELQHRKLSA